MHQNDIRKNSYKNENFLKDAQFFMLSHSGFTLNKAT